MAGYSGRDDPGVMTTRPNNAQLTISARGEVERACWADIGSTTRMMKDPGKPTRTDPARSESPAAFDVAGGVKA